MVLDLEKRTCSWLKVVIEASYSVVLEIGKITCSWLTIEIEASCSVVLEIVKVTLFHRSLAVFYYALHTHQTD